MNCTTLVVLRWAEIMTSWGLRTQPFSRESTSWLPSWPGTRTVVSPGNSVLRSTVLSLQGIILQSNKYICVYRREQGQGQCEGLSVFSHEELPPPREPPPPQTVPEDLTVHRYCIPLLYRDLTVNRYYTFILYLKTYLCTRVFHFTPNKH